MVSLGWTLDWNINATRGITSNSSLVGRAKLAKRLPIAGCHWIDTAKIRELALISLFCLIWTDFEWHPVAILVVGGVSSAIFLLQLLLTSGNKPKFLESTYFKIERKHTMRRDWNRFSRRQTDLNQSSNTAWRTESLLPCLSWRPRWCRQCSVWPESTPPCQLTSPDFLWLRLWCPYLSTRDTEWTKSRKLKVR